MNLVFRVCRTESDIDAADQILVAAYQFKNSIKAAVRLHLSLQTDGWWLALTDGISVGFGGAVDYGPFSSLGMFAVYPSWQRLGIGDALTRQVVAWQDARSCPTTILEAEELAVSLYKRHGFVEESITPQMVFNETNGNMPPSPDVAVLQVTDIPELVAFDTPYFGAERGKLFYAYLKDHPGRAFLVRDQAGQITGYLFARRASVGPWIARTTDDAQRLLTHALSLPFDSGLLISIPAENEEGLQLLRRYKFSEKSVTRFMYRGTPPPTQRGMIYAQASPALG